MSLGVRAAWRSRAGTMRCMLVLTLLRQATQQPPGSVPSAGVHSAGHADTPVETDHERRARRKARKEMRRLAAALAEAPHTPTEFEG
ncbi:hypothetical protein B0H14DRAFT_2958072, partial [Mycena olivaceomarginata]